MHLADKLVRPCQASINSFQLLAICFFSAYAVSLSTAENFLSARLLWCVATLFLFPPA
ncbi:hypothetical protein BOTBODRAFT_34033, partial [Botryobasidium botryosum FD-172 SS1]